MVQTKKQCSTCYCQWLKVQSDWPCSAIIDAQSNQVYISFFKKYVFSIDYLAYNKTSCYHILEQVNMSMYATAECSND